MAVYRIFPQQDTFIFTEQPTGNAGKDEIIEIGGYPNSTVVGQTNRILTQFADTEISNVVDNIQKLVDEVVIFPYIFLLF